MGVEKKNACLLLINLKKINILKRYNKPMKRNATRWYTQTRLKFIYSERSGGDRSISGKYFPKSSTCVIDNGELLSLTLILIVSLEI